MNQSATDSTSPRFFEGLLRQSVSFVVPVAIAIYNFIYTSAPHLKVFSLFILIFSQVTFNISGAIEVLSGPIGANYAPNQVAV